MHGITQTMLALFAGVGLASGQTHNRGFDPDELIWPGPMTYDEDCVIPTEVPPEDLATPPAGYSVEFSVFNTDCTLTWDMYNPQGATQDRFCVPSYCIDNFQCARLTKRSRSQAVLLHGWQTPEIWQTDIDIRGGELMKNRSLVAAEEIFAPYGSRSIEITAPEDGLWDLTVSMEIRAHIRIRHDRQSGSGDGATFGHRGRAVFSGSVGVSSDGVLELLSGDPDFPTIDTGFREPDCFQQPFECQDEFIDQGIRTVTYRGRGSAVVEITGPRIEYYSGCPTQDCVNFPTQGGPWDGDGPSIAILMGYCNPVLPYCGVDFCGDAYSGGNGKYPSEFGGVDDHYARLTMAFSPVEGYDCDGDLVPDVVGDSSDWNGNGIPDLCDILNGVLSDCDGDQIPDEQEIADDPSLDCNLNGLLDFVCEELADEDANGVADECQIADDPSLDCNGNQRLDPVEIAVFTEWDCNQNGLPDSCERDRLPSLDLNGDGVLDDCVPAYRVRDLEAMLGIGSSYNVTDISDTGLLVAWSNPVNVHILDLHTGARHDYQIPDTIAAQLTSINNHGEFASASDVGNETVVWAGVVGEPGVREVARIEHDAVRSLYYSRPYGLSDAGVILIEANSDRGFSNDVWQHRILAVNIRTGSVATARAAHQYPKAVFPDGRLVLRKYGPFTPGRVRITTASFTVLDEYFPPDWNDSHPSRYWEIERSGASATGAVAMRQQRTSNQFSNSPVLVLPSRAEVPRRIEFVGLGDEDNFDQGAWISDRFTMVAYEYQTVPRAWPTPEQPSISYPVNELITENPDGVPIDSGNTAGFAKRAGVSGPGVFADDWKDLIYEPLPTSPPGLDLTANGETDDADLLALVQYLAGQGPQPTGDADLNRDGSVDEEDAQALAWWLIASRAGTLPDCDGDGTPDLAQLARFGGTLPDADNDLVPDGCVPSGCNLADLVPPLGLHDLADVVAFVDGFAAGDTALDFDGSGLLDLADIVAFVTAFGAGCP